MDNKKIGECLKLYFKHQCKTQEEVAAMLGVTYPRVNALLNGIGFGKKEAVKWEILFGISALWLIAGRGPMLTDGTTPQYITDYLGNCESEVSEASAPSNTPTPEPKAEAEVSADMARLIEANHTLSLSIAELLNQQGRLITLLENTKK